MTREVDASNLPGAIWTAEVKLRGLGQVFSMSTGDPPFGEEALKGVSYLLLGLADDLNAIREAMEG
jgi:hypothetical protein